MNDKEIRRFFSIGIAIIFLVISMVVVSAEEDCAPQINLPDDSVTMYAWEFPNDLFGAYKIELNDIVSAVDVYNGAYPGWCVDFGTNIGKGHDHPHNVQLFSSYDSNLPDYLVHENWSKVNYVINNRGDVNPVDVQRVIYRLINFGPWQWDYTDYAPMGDTVNCEVVNSMIDEAKTNVEEGWCPDDGDKMAVICDPGVEHPFQITFIEVVLGNDGPFTCSPVVDLPDGTADFFAEEFPDGFPSAYKIELADISGDVDVQDGLYNGWCVDFGTSIDEDGQPHDAQLFSSYDSNLPEHLAHENWSKVNYVINHVSEGADVVDVQLAIYRLINFGPWKWDHSYGPVDILEPEYSIVDDLVDDALLNSGSWCPGCGDKIAVICDPGVNHPFQITFIEVVLCEQNPTIGEPSDPTNGDTDNIIEESNEDKPGVVVSGTRNRPPVAVINIDPIVGFVGEDIGFDGSDSTDDGSIKEWFWEFGDGTTVTGEIVTYQYLESGTFTVRLTVTDNTDRTNTVEETVVIRQPNNPPSMPVISGSKTGSVEKSNTYSFTASDVDGDLVRYVVDWGDDSEDTSLFVDEDTSVELVHTWESSGLYEISVYAEDEYNAVSDGNTLLVMVDVGVSFIDDEIHGYLLDEDNDGRFDVFYSNETKAETIVETQSDGSVLIDGDGDGVYEYLFGSAGLVPYEESTGDSQKVSGDDMPWLFVLLGLLAAIFIVILVMVKKGIIYLE